MTDYKQEFMKCLQSIDRSKRSYDIFQDFLTVSTLAFRNVIEKKEEFEKQYQEIIKRYENPNKLAELLTITMCALEEKPQDFLGQIYMFGNFGNKGTGQFFTPYHISEFMADITIFETNPKQKIEEQGFISVCEPCCGSGGMIIAASESLKKQDINPQKYMWFQGVDIDNVCCKMAYIQTTLLGLSGEIVYGNTLTLETWDTYITPMSLITMNHLKFEQKQIQLQEKERNITNPTIDSNVYKINKENGQLQLF